MDDLDETKMASLGREVKNLGLDVGGPGGSPFKIFTSELSKRVLALDGITNGMECFFTIDWLSSTSDCRNTEEKK